MISKKQVESERDELDEQRLKLEKHKRGLEDEVKTAKEEILQSRLQDAEKSKASFGDFFEKYEEAKKETRRLEEEIARQKRDLEQKDTEVVHAVQQHSQSLAKLDQLWQQHEALKHELAAVKHDLTDAQKSLDNVSKRNVTLARQKQDADQSRGQLQTSLDKLASEKLAQDAAFEDKVRTIQVLNGTVQQLNGKNSGKTATIDRMTQEVESLKVQLSTTQAQKEEAEKKLTALRKSSGQTKKALDDCESSLGIEKNSCQALQGKLETEQKALKVMKANLDAKEEELLRLHSAKRALERRTEDQDSSVQSLELKLKKSQDEVNQWTEKCEGVSAELEETKAAKSSLERDKQKLKAENAANESKMQRLQGRLDGKGDDLSRKEKEYSDLLRKYEETKAKFDAGQELLPEKEERIFELEKEKHDLEEDLRMTTKQRDNSRRKVEELTEEVQGLEADQKKKKDAISKFQSADRENLARICRLEDKLRDEVAAKKKCEATLEAESSKALKAERSLDALKEASDRLEKEKQGLLHQSQKNKWLDKLEKEKKLQGLLHSANESLKRSVSELTEELHKEQDEKQRILEKLDESTTEVESTRKELASMEVKLENTEALASDAKESLKKCSLELKRVTRRFNEKRQELLETDRKLKDRIKEYDTSEDAQLVLIKEKEDLKAQLAEAEETASTVQNLKEEVVEAKKELVAVKTNNTVLEKALVQKSSESLHLKEENSVLKAHRNDHQKIRQQKRKLRMDQAELQRDKLEVHAEKTKLQEMQKSNEQVQSKLEHLMDTMLASSATLKASLSAVDHGTEHTAQLEGRVVDVERTLQMLSDTTKHFGAALRKGQSNSSGVTSHIPGLDAMQIRQDMLQRSFRTGTECTGDEAMLQQLCCMATGIKQLVISPAGGKFPLGSDDPSQANGDASLEVPPGAVEKETSVWYAIILHGPFVFPAGYKPGSVVVYLKMDGATLVKPVQLLLSHWCVREEGDENSTLKFVRASHTLKAEKKFVFEEVQEDFSIYTNMGVLTIKEPQCLYCVQQEEDSVAWYNAMTFTQYFPSKGTLLFRIQLMCSSKEWNEKLECTLQQNSWEKASNTVAKFRYAADQDQITASPEELLGPGWKAVIDGQHAVKEDRFSAPSEISKSETEQDIINGLFPPCILYKIFYTSPEDQRVKPNVMITKLHGADVRLSFGCGVKEEMTADPPGSPGFPEHVRDNTASIKSRDILDALNHRLDAQWRHFGTFLGVEYQVMEAIQRGKGGNPTDCMLDLLGKWTSNQAGTGTLPRTWQTVVEAVKKTGDGVLAETLAHKHGVNL